VSPFRSSIVRYYCREGYYLYTFLYILHGFLDKESLSILFGNVSLIEGAGYGTLGKDTTINYDHVKNHS
jgi:hypothetical protein